MDSGQQAWQWLGERLGPHAPRLAGALAILVAAWLVARLVRGLVLAAGGRAGLDHKLHHQGISLLLADLARWLVWLLALPALLDTLGLPGLLQPINAMLSQLLGFLPRLLAAGVVLGVGLLMGSVAQRIVTGLLTAAGSERLAERLGLGPALGQRTLAGIGGSALFALMLLPTITAALQALGLDAVTRPVSQLLDSVVALVPRLLSAAIILALSALIGRALAGAASGLAAGLGINRLPALLGWARAAPPGARQASDLLGSVVMATVMVVALAQAGEVLGLPVLTEAVTTMGGVLAKLAAAVLVAVVGLWLGQVAAQLVQSSGVLHGRVLGNLARAAVLFFAGALALRQAGLPPEIVTIAFGAVVGALALGLAVAVGVGGRHVAGRLLERAAAAFEPPSSGSGAAAAAQPDHNPDAGKTNN